MKTLDFNFPDIMYVVFMETFDLADWSKLPTIRLITSVDKKFWFRQVGQE